MSTSPAKAGGGSLSSVAGVVPFQKKRTKIVFLNPTEIADWDDLKSTNEHKLIGETDLLQYEEMLKNHPRKSSSVDSTASAPGPSESSKRRGRSKNHKNGSKKRVIDPSQPWLEDTDSDEQDVGLEDELDDDEYFRRLEEEKLREDEEEARRKREISEARALARARGQAGRALACSLKSTGDDPIELSNTFVRTKGRVPRATRIGLQTGRLQFMETSDSEASFSEFGDGTMSSMGGSRADCEEFDNPRSLYPHEEENEDEALLDDDNLNEKDDIFVPPSPSDRQLNASEMKSGGSAQPSLDAPFSALVPTDSYTLRMLAMDPIRLRYCSPPLHLPTSASDLVCPTEHLLNAFEVYEVLIRYGYLLRLSPFKIEDFLAALVANENSTLLAEVHIVLLRALLREDEATGTWMYSIDCKDSVTLSYHLLDRYNWPYLLATYLSSIKSTEMAARTAALNMTAISGPAGGAAAGSAGAGAATAALDTILTAAVFPEDLIPLEPGYPFVSIKKRVAVLRGLVNLFLATRSVRADQLRDGYLTHEDHCRACQQSGEVLCCDGCTAVFHLNCLHPPLNSIPPANWVCPVCLKKQIPGVHDCLTEEERARKVHRKEPLGSDRAGRVYWYIARRVLVEPTDFTQREPCLPGILDGVYDPHWQQAYADRFCSESDEDEDEDGVACSGAPWTVDEIDTASEHPLRRVRCDPSSEYASEPPLYYYSTLEQVVELRARLSARWEPWLCQRLDALMPRLRTEMPVTQQLTTDGLDTFCRLWPDFERVDVTRALEWSGLPAPRSHVTRVFALLEAEAKRSQLRMKLSGEPEEVTECRSIDDLIKVPPTLDLGFLEPRAPDHLPDDLLNELPHGEECAGSSFLGILVTCDADTCLVHNHDGLVTRVAKSHVTANHRGLYSTVFTPNERASYHLTNRSDQDHEPDAAGSALTPPVLRAYRLSDEGSWRSWSNLYTVGVWLGSEQQQQDASRSDKAGPRAAADDGARQQPTADEDADAESAKSTGNAPVNVLFSRAQLAEERERRRVLGNKFSLTDMALELWNYLEPPLLASYYTDLVELLKCPCDLDDRLFRPDWPATPWRLLDVVRLTLGYMEAQIPLAFYTPAWRSLRKRWLSQLMQASTPAHLAEALATLEVSIRPMCYQRIWFSSVGHLIFERTTAPQREEDRRVRQLDRSAAALNAANSTGGASNLPANLIRTKTPNPIRHTVWKSRGEEYRRLGGDGWIWLSATRRSARDEADMARMLHPPINQLVGSGKSTTTTAPTRKPSTGTRGLQHGIGWGVCPEYLQGELPVKPPKASECRGHVLHPITGIPLYLNTRRMPYIIAPDVLRQTQPPAVCKTRLDADVEVEATVTTSPKETEQPFTSSDKKNDTEPSDCITEAQKPDQSASAGSAEGATSLETVVQSMGPHELVVTEPPVVDVCFGLSERIHFPAPVVRQPQTTKSITCSSRRLRFRLDDLLAGRQAAAKADREAAESARSILHTLEQDIRQLEERRTQLETRLTDLSQQAQEARTAKAKAVKARQAAGTSMLQSSSANMRSNSLIVSTAGAGAGRSINLAALQQQQLQAAASSHGTRRLIQHSFISTSSGNRYRILPQTVCRSGDADLTMRAVNRPIRARRKPTRSRRRSGSEDGDDQDDDEPEADEHDADYDPSGEFSGTRVQQLRRSARKQRAVRRDPDFVVDFDDDDEEENEVDDAGTDDDAGSKRSRGRRRAAAATAVVGYSDEDSDDADFGPRARLTSVRLPQLDGAGDSSSVGESDERELESETRRSSDRPIVPTTATIPINGPPSPKKSCPDFDKPAPAVSNSAIQSGQPGARQSGIINRIVRLVRSTDQSNNLTSSSSINLPNHSKTLIVAGSADSACDCSSTAALQTPSPNLVTSLATQPSAEKAAPDSLRFVVASSSQIVSQMPTSSVGATDASTTTPAPAVVNLPPGYRLVSVNSSSGPSTAPVRLVGTSLIRAIPATATSSSTTNASCAAVGNRLSTAGTNSSTVRLVLQSSSAAPTVTTTVNPDSSQSIVVTPVSLQANGVPVTASTSAALTSTTTILSESTDPNYASRGQPAILRRTLAAVADSKPAASTASEFRMFTLPQTQTQSLASLVATNTARQMAGAMPTTRDGLSDAGDSAGFLRISNKTVSVSRGTPLIEHRALPSAHNQRPLAPRVIPRRITIPAGSTMMTVPVNCMVVQSDEAQVALDRAVVEASERLERIDAEVAEVQRQLTEINQKLKHMTFRATKLRQLQQYADQCTSAPYSLHRRRSFGDENKAAILDQATAESADSAKLSRQDDQVLLPVDLPPVNHYVWPPVEWPAAKKRGFPSTSSLFRLHPRNLRGLILAAGRRELPGFDAEKKRLVQVVWPYPTAKPSLVETWRFRLSQLRLSDPAYSQTLTNEAEFAGQHLASLVLLLRTLWHVIRWDELLADPPDGDHVLDEDGRPCLREVTDYADSGSAKSGEPAYCTRRIIGIQPLDRFWLRANYLVQLTHTRPGRERTNRSRKSRLSVTRSGRRSVAARRPWATGFDSRPAHRRSGRKSGKRRLRRDDPDYNPTEDEPWRASGRRSHRRRRRGGSDEDDDDEDEDHDDDLDGDLDDSTSDDVSCTAGDRGSDRISQVEEVWMSEESLRMWEIRVFMNTFLPPSSDYLNCATTSSGADSMNRSALLQARRKPARLALASAANKSSQLTKDEQQPANKDTTKPDLDETDSMMGLSGAVPLSLYVDAQTARRLGPGVGFTTSSGLPSGSTLSATSTGRRSRPVPDLTPPPVVSAEVLEARARARSIAATRAARASVAARKAKAERMVVEQRARSIRAQLITRRRLYLNLARTLADEAVAERRRILFGNDDESEPSEDEEEEDVNDEQSSKHSPIRSQPGSLATDRFPPTSATPVFARRPRGRPPTSGRYRGSRGLRRPLTTSQMQATDSPTGSLGAGVALSKAPLHTVTDSPVDAQEEQENKPEWVLGRGNAGSGAYRPRCLRRGSVPGRRGRPRGRGLSRPVAPSLIARRIPEPLLLTTPGANSPARSDASSAPSTPSTCPGLGDPKLEALLAMPGEAEYNFKSSIKLEQTDSCVKPSYVGRGGSRARGGRGRGGRGAKREAASSVVVTDPRNVKPCPMDSPPRSVPFPTHTAVVQEPVKQTADSHNDEVYCLCRTPYDPNREYLGCDLCQDWFHFECVGLTPSDASKLGDSWHCPDCRQAEERANEMLYCLCRTPYEPTRVYIACDRCDEWYHAECVGLTAQQAATHAGTYLCPRCSDTPGLGVAKIEDEAVAESAGGVGAVTRTLYETTLDKALRVQLVALLQELREHKMSWPFLQPPDPDKYPNTSSLEDPKCLPRITERLADGQYNTLGDFSFAMNSLFFDARTLFLKGTPEFNCTEVMEALFIQKMKELKTRSTPSP